MDAYSKKTLDHFLGKVVRKDLTMMMKRGANVPSYVLEYLLGMYCATDDQNAINTGVKKIEKILSTNYIRSDEIEKTKYILSQKGEYSIIDKVYGYVDADRNLYYGVFSNFDLGFFVINNEFATKYPKLFSGGIWCMAKIKYNHFSKSEENISDANLRAPKKTNRKQVDLTDAYSVIGLKPIQLPEVDIDKLKSERQFFTLDEWTTLMLRSTGIEATNLNEKEKFHFLERIIPMFERNYNLVELGPRGTGKSHIYKEVSPYSVLISGGQSSVSSLFYNLTRHTVGLVGNWDLIAFDEIAGMGFNNPNGIQILKDYMASGSFTRGKETIYADASMVFIGNINDTVENMLKKSHLLVPFPKDFRSDSAFFDRMHYYLPGWEVPKIKSDLLTEEFGFISDYFAEFAKAMRKEDLSHAFDQWFTFNKNVTTRDETAIRKTVSGFLKMLFPDRSYTKEDVEKILTYAIEGRRRVKEQLRKISGEEFADVDLGYIRDDGREVIVNVPERASNSLFVPNDLKPGQVFSIGRVARSQDTGAYKIECKLIDGNGKIDYQGINNFLIYESGSSLKAGWRYFQEKHANVIAQSYSWNRFDYLLTIDSLQRKKESVELSVAEFISLCSALMNKKVREGYAVIGEVTLSGSLNEVTGIEDYLRVAVNAGTKMLLMPNSVKETYNVVASKEIYNLNVCFYDTPEEAARIMLDMQHLGSEVKDNE